MSPFRWLPSPGLSLFLLVLWLLLNNSFSAGHLLLGAFFGWLIPVLTTPLSNPQAKVKRPWLAVRYILRLFKDIVVSNLLVAIQVCGPLKKLHPGLLVVPLDTDEDLIITLLASTISLTPGTVSVDTSADGHFLYVHALHLEDEAATVAEIKARYEQPLKEIFGC